MNDNLPDNNNLTPKEQVDILNNELDLPDPLSVPELPNANQPQDNKLPPEPKPEPMVKSGLKSNSIKSLIFNLLIFVILFFVGVTGSLIINKLFLTPKNPETPKTEIPIVITQTKAPDVTGSWNLFEILSATDGNPQISISIPQNMLTPICDGQSCVSKGTYMDGGTRFTVSVRDNPTNINFSQTIVTDITGKQFETKDATISGLIAREFSGDFIGTTAGGYRFTKMHGFLIKANETKLVEINHFAPAGITTDFISDDEVFNKIITTLQISSQSNVKNVQYTPTSTLTPKKCLPYINPCDPQSCDYDLNKCQLTPTSTSSTNEPG